MSADGIREITQESLDNMVSGQRKFFEELIQQGRARIVSTTPATEGGERQRRSTNERAPSPLDRLKDKTVALTCNNGTTLEGSITEIGQFEITLLTTEGPIVVLKHGFFLVRELVP